MPGVTSGHVGGSVGQLLRLVHNASVGLPTTSRAAAMWAREFSGAANIRQPFVLRRQTSHAAQSRNRSENIRTYGAAALSVSEEIEHDEEDQNEAGKYTSFPSYQQLQPPNPAPQKRPDEAKDTQASYPHISGALGIPSALYNSAKDRSITPTQFRDMFIAKNLQPATLAHLPTLTALWDLWYRGYNDTNSTTDNTPTEPSLWAWLGGQLGHLLHTPTTKHVRAQAQAIRAYALMQLHQAAQAKEALLVDEHAIARSPLGLAISCAVYRTMKENQRADRAFALMCRRVASGGYPIYSAMVPLVQELIQGYGEDGGSDAMLRLIKDAARGKELRHRLLHLTARQPRGAVEEALYGMLMDAMADHPDPVVWMDRELDQDDTHGTRWMGCMIVAAQVKKGDVGKARQMAEWIEENDLPLPVGVTLNLVLALVRSGEAGADELRRLLDTGDLSHTALSQILGISANKAIIDVGDTAWTKITSAYAPTPHDKRLYARLAALQDDDETFRARILRLFGSLDKYESLDAMLHRYINANNVSEAQATFRRLVDIRPSAIVYNRVLAFYAIHALANEAVELFDEMLDRGIQPGLSSLTSLIALFANRRDVENARNVFDMIPELGFTPDAAAWTALINAEVEAGEWTAAAKHWTTMPEVLRDEDSVVSVILKAYVLLSTPAYRVLDIFRRATKPTSYMWSLVIQSAVDGRDFSLATSLFEEMRLATDKDSQAPTPSVFHYSILLYGYMQDKNQIRAREVYNLMLDRGIIPTSVTYGMMLSSWRHAEGPNAFAQASRFAASVHIHSTERSEAPRARGSALENIYGPLVSISGRLGDLETAESYVQLLGVEGSAAKHPRPAQALTMYTRLMDAYRAAGRTDSVLAIWDQIYTLALRVSKETTSKTLDGVATRRSADNSLCIPLSIVLDTLAAAGRYFDVRQVWKKVQDAGFGFDAMNYNHYAVALARTGDVERAFEVVEQVLLPRWAAVQARQNASMREAEDRSQATPVPVEDTESGLAETEKLSDILGIPTQPVARPPNRRYENRWNTYNRITMSWENGTDSGVDIDLLKAWRPADLLWRPSVMTISVLEHVYSQLQDAKSRAWFVLPDVGGDGEAEAEIEGEGKKRGGQVVTLPSFGDVPVRNLDGEVRKASPGALILRLNRKYAKTVALIMFHRRKRQAHKVRQARGE